MTDAPEAMACSAWLICCWASPSALTMLYSTPASSKACSKNRRSSVSQRAEEALSGSSTQMLPSPAVAVSPLSSPSSAVSSACSVVSVASLPSSAPLSASSLLLQAVATTTSASRSMRILVIPVRAISCLQSGSARPMPALRAR